MLRRASLKLGTAWGVSLAIHIALIAILTLVAFRVAFEPPPPARSIDFDEVGGPAPMVAGPEPLTGDAADLSPTGPAIAPALPTPALDGLPSPVAPATPHASPSEASGGWPDSTSLSAGSRDAARGGASAPASETGAARPPAGEVKFAGLGSSNAGSVVYVVDASGPMVSALAEVVDELDRSISRLGATQRFGVVAFGGADGAPGYASFMPVLVRATPQAKNEVRRWLAELSPAGRSNPLAGLRAALKLKPDAVFLLSRGIERSGGGAWELGLDSTLAELDTLNPVHAPSGRRRVVIKTIQFLDEDPTGTMQRIGQLHGETVSTSGARQPGYRVIRRGSELAEDAPLEVEP